MRTLLVLLLLLGSRGLLAHESLPASLLLVEQQPGEFTASWRVPAVQGGAALAISPQFPADCQVLRSAPPRMTASSQVSDSRLRCSDGLRDALIRFDGMPASLINALVRVQYLDGHSLTRIASPAEPQVQLQREQPQAVDIGGYFGLGVEHILGGLDHLLFVFCLILLVRAPLALVKTITAFTVAHSITLAAATLGYVQVPGAPVEACIALSILFLACELRRPAGQDLASRRPWLVAFSFGLLHGLGFAGALSEVGLPQGDIPLALLLFNLGVEAGQLLFVTVVLAVLALLRRLQRRWPQWLQQLPLYAAGSLAGFWFLQRMSLLLGWQAV
ncbi:HupE/UreJ family protein [Pseudomonas sp. N040]|nr:HupE/UreJ family protein [Pseudomonas sp. N040]